MRTFVIGDVHGMSDELAALHYKLEPEPGDRFAFLGDYVDKGPDSLEALRMVRMLVSHYPGSVAIAGNHEESALALYDKAQKAGSWEGLRKADKEPWLKDMTDSDYQWAKSLPLFARLPGVLLIHGGLFPAFFDNYDALPSASPEDWHKGGGRVMSRMRRFLRIRHVFNPETLNAKGKDVSGQMVSMGDEGESTHSWAESYDGCEGFAFYGHAPQRSGRVLKHEHAMGLDTGAVFGGRLTAAVFEPGQSPDQATLISVQGRKMAEWLESFEA